MKSFRILVNAFAALLVISGWIFFIRASHIEDTSSIEYLKLMMYSDHSFIEALLAILINLLIRPHDQSSSEEHSKECKQEE